MSRELRDRRLAVFCDVLDQVAPDAPTLCEGWDAHDLAVHLWTLKHDPLAWPAMDVDRLADYGARRAARVRARWSYAELVAQLRHGGGGIACMAGDRFEGHRHALGEYVVHTEDVARPNRVERPAPDAPLEDALWRRLRVAAWMLHRRRTPGLVLEVPDGRSAQVTRGPVRTVVRGAPIELMLWVYGRTAVADVVVR